VREEHCPYIEHFLLDGYSGPMLCNHPDPEIGDPYLSVNRSLCDQERKRALEATLPRKSCNDMTHKDGTMFSSFRCPVVMGRYMENDAPNEDLEQSTLEVS